MEELIVMKILDIPYKGVSASLRQWIRVQATEYRDQVCSEHLYSVSLEDEVPEKFKKEFNEVIRDNATRLDCCYFRIISNG